MARLITGWGSIQSTVESIVNPDPSNDNSQEGTTINLRSKIESSTIYQQAYTLFSSLNDSTWLLRLESIVNSVVGPAATGLDDLGLSTNYQDKVQAIEAEAYNQIQKLISGYHTYKQELPVTQVQDFADAGINSAITGNGIDGASISGKSSERDMSPYQMESSNPLESISSIGNLIFSASDGILSAIQVFNQIGVNRETLKQSSRSSHWTIQKDLMELGFSSFPLSSSVDDFDKWWNTSGAKEAKQLNLGKSAVNKLRSDIQNFSAGEASNRLLNIAEDGSYFLSDVGQSIVNKMVDFEIMTWQKTAEYKKAYAEYMSLYQATLDPVKLANLQMDKESFQKALLDNQIDSAGDDAQARAIIARVLMNVSATESVQLQNFAGFSDAQVLNNYLTPLGTATGAISNLPLL